jgi:hypothetical protein
MPAPLHILVAGAVAAILALVVPVQGAQAQTMGRNATGATRIFVTPSYEQRTGPTPGIGATGPMEYFGGTVFSQVDIVSVIWGPGVDKTIVAEIPDFSAAIVNSTFTDQLGAYSTKHQKTVDHHKGSDQTISRGLFFGEVQVVPKNKSLTLTDKDIQQELIYQIGIGALPPQGPNMLYMIYFPADISIVLGGSTSCKNFGAYHSALSNRETRSNIFYSVEPDCNDGFGFITYAASHEFAEATTDNIATSGTNPKFPQAWNTSSGYEIADLCGGYSGTLTDATGSYEVTQVYLNSTAACSTGNYTSP